MLLRRNFKSFLELAILMFAMRWLLALISMLLKVNLLETYYNIAVLLPVPLMMFLHYKYASQDKVKIISFATYLVGGRLDNGIKYINPYGRNRLGLYIIFALKGMAFMIAFSDTRFYGLVELITIAVLFTLTLLSLRLISDGKLYGILSLIGLDVLSCINDILYLEDDQHGSFIMIYALVNIIYLVIYLIYSKKQNPSLN